MRIFLYLLRSAAGVLLVVSVAALLYGGLNAGLIAMVHAALSDPKRIGLMHALGFAALVIGRLATGYLSEMTLLRYAQRSMAELRRSLIRKLLAVPLRRFELAGTARVYASLTDDVAMVNGALFALPGFIVALAMLAGGAAYLLYLSPLPLLWIGLLALLGTAAYRIAARSARAYFERARDDQDRLYALFRALTEGSKELKLNAKRRAAFMQGEVQPGTESLVENMIAAHNRYFAARATSSLFFFLLVGLLLFLLPIWQEQSAHVLSGYLLTCLFLMGPFNTAARIGPVFSQGAIALDRIEKLGLSLDDEPTEAAADPSAATAVWKRIEIAAVTLAYRQNDGDTGFVLGPVDLALSPGELLFITGGNGSGKSTLAKLIAGLYQPDAGEIRLDGKPIDDADRDAYRQLFSALFSDFFLFDSLLGLEAPDLDGRAAGFLQLLRLDHKVTVSSGALSCTDLSQGQRKRLALLTALLEDRPVYLFDEWAADQDPEFKSIFYSQLVPALVRQGKTAIVITHDDRYFHLADRLLVMEEGRVARVEERAGDGRCSGTP